MDLELFEHNQLDRIEEKLDKILQLLQADPKKAATLTDEVWLEGLCSDKAYAGVDVRAEVGKCVQWCEVNRKMPSRRRIIAWLNRAEKPVRYVAPAPQVPPAFKRRETVPVVGEPAPPDVAAALSRLMNKKWGM